jgi:asparagine synthase (glutamine-hydrolysing)
VCSIPLFYTQVDSHTVIGNYAPSLKKAAYLESKDLDYGAALEVAMSAYTIGNKTLYKGLFKLTAGECLLANKEKIEKCFYYTYSPWQVVNRNKTKLKSELTDCLLETFDDLIKSADDRQIVIPLSAGNDSRLVASGLKHLGLKNVFCFAYGHYKHFESKTSKSVAEKLNYSWTHVPLSRKIQRDFFSSSEFDEFLKNTNTLSSVPHLQEVNAIGLLKKSGKISKDAIFINGNTGDFISGGHIPLSLKVKKINSDNTANILTNSWSDFINKHYSLWGVLKSEVNNNYIRDALGGFIEHRSAANVQDVNQIHGVFECLEYLGRQSNYIINMQRAYEFHDYNWRVPLWSDQMLNFWSKVPRSYKINQNLYKEVLIENNWGGVWHNLQVNSGKIHSNKLKLARFTAKVVFSPFEVNAWHNFERKVFQYFLDNSVNSAIVPYYKALFDNRGQRNSLSWLAEIYLNNNGFESISDDFLNRM